MQPMVSATIFKSILDFWIFIPNICLMYSTQRSTGQNTFGLCSDIVTRFWCYLDIELTILTVSHNIWRFLAIYVLNHLVILLSTTAAGVTIVDHFDVKTPFLYSNLKASPDHRMTI